MAEIENVNNKANVGVTLGGVGLGVALLNAIHNGGGFLSGLFGCGAGNMANAAATVMCGSSAPWWFPKWKRPMMVIYGLEIFLVCFRHLKSVWHLLAHFAFCVVFYAAFLAFSKASFSANLSAKSSAPFVYNSTFKRRVVDGSTVQDRLMSITLLFLQRVVDPLLYLFLRFSGV